MRTFLFISLILSIISCKPSRYITSSYDQLAPGHNTIAILPFSMYYGGRIPDKSAEELSQLKDDEAIMFQRSLYYQVLDEAGPGEKDVHIRIQDINETNRLLEENGIVLHEAAKTDLSRLGKILGVEGLVQVDLHKSFWLTNTEAVAIEVISTVLNTSLKIPSSLNRLNKTNEIRLYANVVDSREKIPVWSYQKQRDTDLNCPPSQVVDNINRMISNRFPYRDKM